MLVYRGRRREAEALIGRDTPGCSLPDVALLRLCGRLSLLNRDELLRGRGSDGAHHELRRGRSGNLYATSPFVGLRLRGPANGIPKRIRPIGIGVRRAFCCDEQVE